jgi:hypothetical protein
MYRPLSTLFLVVVPALFLLPSAAPSAPPCVNTLPHEPVVVYEVSGGTLGGYLDLQLCVYNDGMARLTRASFDGANSKSQLVFVGETSAFGLASDLSQLGIWVQCDDTNMANDVPLQTVTVLRGATDARAHTYSWWLPNGAYAPIEQRLSTFVAASFPNF